MDPLLQVRHGDLVEVHSLPRDCERLVGVVQEFVVLRDNSSVIGSPVDIPPSNEVTIALRSDLPDNVAHILVGIVAAVPNSNVLLKIEIYCHDK